ncbi:5-methyltetrahydropteroyltriglutamate--homocysteine S-methyltransferase [Jiangella asiatica]|uniref:5-methyltetrahydropteroyltriglutamate-- homocysteine S-methyltransferase n=1 Tax=Jiangella asiatica TaxID=2530372 RepID=UPI001EF06BC9|nr:5-methyltetrahydropteroyltriglutamate--homocysteine S-methyltransferase [Jiangella asiatica]
MNRNTEPIGATVLGYPRIGRDREIKRALEDHWAGSIGADDLASAGAAERARTWRRLAELGLDSVPSGTFSLYDHVLDTTTLVGAVPPRYAELGLDDLGTYFAMARGTAGVAPLELTKWFDTNYHYLVPEIGPATRFRLAGTKPLDEYREALALGITTRPALLGPVSLLLLSKAADGSPDGFRPLDRLDDLVAVYALLLTTLATAGVAWVQLDEPAFVADRTPAELDALRIAYERLGALAERPAILVASYFGHLGEALPVLASSPVEAIGLDLVAGDVDALTGDVPGLAGKTVVAGVVDGRNVWRTDLGAALATLSAVADVAGDVAVSTSCSLLHVPYDLDAEAALSPRLRSWLAFADQKVAEVVALATALRAGQSAVSGALDEAAAALADRAGAPGVVDDGVRSRLAGLPADAGRRGPYAERASAQRDRLGLPPLPTTTIGSFPQTDEVRGARAAFRAGRLGADEYTARMRAEIERVIRLQEKLGLDVLVHGEPERNDMVQYFAENLAGFVTTGNGWVQSYGSRCVRPPILYGDVSRPAPITVDWARYAQSLTDRPVKGMLTGPVTILAWSFVRDDQPLADTARQVALAIRDETVDLEAAGIGIVQVDEPALRELLPLRSSGQDAYLEWSVGAFGLATSGVTDATQIHTHLCYSEFGEVVAAIDGLDADVTSIEAARSHMEIVPDVAASGFARGIGPGMYDIHSPRVPDTDEVEALLRRALAAIPAARLWVNPDCGLKTRGYAEVEPALAALVAAAHRLR